MTIKFRECWSAPNSPTCSARSSAGSARRTARSHWSPPTTCASGSGTRRCRCCSNAGRQRAPGDHPRRAPRTAAQRPRRHQPDRRRRAPLGFSPHDFRRIFVTDAVLNGLPPHIAQIIAGHATSTPRSATRRSTRTRQSKPTARSSPADARSAPARNTAVPPTRNGTSSSPTSRSAKSPSAPAHAPTPPPASTNTPASDARSYGQIPRSEPGSKRSATTCTPASPKPNAKAGSARSKDSKSASPAPKTSSPRSTTFRRRASPPSSASPPSPRSPDAPSAAPPWMPRTNEIAKPNTRKINI